MNTLSISSDKKGEIVDKNILEAMFKDYNDAVTRIQYLLKNKVTVAAAIRQEMPVLEKYLLGNKIITIARFHRDIGEGLEESLSVSIATVRQAIRRASPTTKSKSLPDAPKAATEKHRDDKEKTEKPKRTPFKNTD